ncbi:tyrosine/serine/threonine protein phosphatase pps1 [Microbotryomycetes sp. JL221]|nr:tyrosine/serine/threonine protein phosphatase pps1 [Microbotryomycetes sp. JL221]
MQVAMHPCMSRSTKANATQDNGRDSEHDDTAFSSPFFSSAVEVLVDHSKPALTPTQSRFDAHQHQLKRSNTRSTFTTAEASIEPNEARVPLHGLTRLDATRYPLLADWLGSHEQQRRDLMDIRVMSANEYAQVERQHSRLCLPERELFPWSHGGADIAWTPASEYFGYSAGQQAPTPSFRGLTTVHAPPTVASNLDNSSAVNSSLRGLYSKWSTSSSPSCSSSSDASSSGTSSSSSSSRSNSPTHNAQGSIDPTCRLVSSLSLDAIVRTTADDRVEFNLPNHAAFKSVNLRHFGLQGAKYASICDIVVYGEHGIDQGVVEAAVMIKQAQQDLWEQRGCQGVRYNVFVVSDAFATFEARYPTLVAVDSNGFIRNKLDFLEREREEMRVLTEATEIAPNVWLGNGQDVPCAPFAYHYSSDSASSLDDQDSNPLSLAVCIEAHDNAHPLSLSALAAADRRLTSLEQTGAAYDEVRRLVEDEQDSTKLVEACSPVLRPHVQDIIHLETPSSISRVGSNCRQQQQFINELVDTALWMRQQATPEVETNKVARRILLHCVDGYTETSLLALTYVMLVRRCSAPEAYLALQQDCARSFFVYPQDYRSMPSIEQRVRDVLKREVQEKRATRRGQWDDERGNDEFDLTSSGMERSDSGYVSNAGSTASSSTSTLASFAGLFGRSSSKKQQQKVVSKVELVRVDSVEQDSVCDPFAEPELQLSSNESDPWFYANTFEGHFPSRILPYLYLGNLNHAMNADMLKQLGITHVVSVGESALNAPKPPQFSSSSLFDIECGSDNTSALWLAERLGNVQVLDMKNVADDGIDSIRPHMDTALDFIEQARWQGGKVLVHCRVGVSRSASIVIAYLMKFIELDLASSYLLTRSRRLNILIQPNLPFMAVLHAFEADLLRQRRKLARQESSSHADQDADEQEDEQTLGRAGLKPSNRLTWNALATEISALNARFSLC